MNGPVFGKGSPYTLKTGLVKTLRAAVLLAANGVGSSITARYGDALASPPCPQPKSIAAELSLVFQQAPRRMNGES